MAENESEKINKNSETEVQSQPPKNSQKEKSVGREIFEWIYSIAIAIAIAFIIKGVFFDVVKVDGQSMENTLFNNDRLIVTKLGYEPKHGDIIILDSNYKDRQSYYTMLAQRDGKTDLSSTQKFIKNFSLPKEYKKVYYVKRIIATEGQTVEITGGEVKVDGVTLSEDYIKGTTYGMSSDFKQTVSEGCVFVMGDNREHSSDSRDPRLGEVPVKAILGHSQLRVFPFRSMGVTK